MEDPRSGAVNNNGSAGHLADHASYHDTMDKFKGLKEWLKKHNKKKIREQDTTSNQTIKTDQAFKGFKNYNDEV